MLEQRGRQRALPAAGDGERTRGCDGRFGRSYRRPRHTVPPAPPGRGHPRAFLPDPCPSPALRPHSPVPRHPSLPDPAMSPGIARPNPGQADSRGRRSRHPAGPRRGLTARPRPRPPSPPPRPVQHLPAPPPPPLRGRAAASGSGAGGTGAGPRATRKRCGGGNDGTERNGRGGGTGGGHGRQARAPAGTAPGWAPGTPRRQHTGGFSRRDCTGFIPNFSLNSLWHLCFFGRFKAKPPGSARCINTHEEAAGQWTARHKGHQGPVRSSCQGLE